MKIVWQYFRWTDEEIRLRRVLKLSYIVFIEAMRQFGRDKYWECLRIFSLKRWGNSGETSFEIVWQYFRWSDEEMRLRRVLKLSYNVFVETMREFGWDKYWDCLRFFSWSSEKIRLKQVLKLSENIFVEMMEKSG